MIGLGFLAINKDVIRGALLGAGLLALFQNLFDYRVDEEFLEYVWDPAVTFVQRLVQKIFGKNPSLAKLEIKGKAVLADVHAKLVNIDNIAKQDVSKLPAEIAALLAEVKGKLA